LVSPRSNDSAKNAFHSAALVEVKVRTFSRRLPTRRVSRSLKTTA